MPRSRSIYERLYPINTRLLRLELRKLLLTLSKLDEHPDDSRTNTTFQRQARRFADYLETNAARVDWNRELEAHPRNLSANTARPYANP